MKHNILPYLLFASAISISLVAATFSIIGLSVIFSGAFWSVMVMGLVLEVAKLVTAVWLHANWKAASRFLRFYLTSAVLILIGITSMGIFGYLSKAHIEHERQAEKVEAVISQIDGKIERESLEIKRLENKINEAKASLENSTSRSDVNFEREEGKIKSLQEAMERDITFEQNSIKDLNARLGALDNILIAIEQKGGFSKSKRLREEKERQAPERAEIREKMTAAEQRILSYRAIASEEIKKIRDKINQYQDEGSEGQGELEGVIAATTLNIRNAQDKIDSLKIQKFDEKDSLQDMESEVGPVKYVAALLKELGIADLENDSAVRMITTIIMFVFDPLAVLMLLAATSSIRMAKGPLEKTKNPNPWESPPRSPKAKNNPTPEKTNDKSNDLTRPPFKKLEAADEGLVVPMGEKGEEGEEGKEEEEAKPSWWTSQKSRLKKKTREESDKNKDLLK